MLPHSLPAFRRATAAFLDFVASPGAQPLSCAPVSTSERAAARTDGAADGANGSSSAAVFTLGKGWFGAVAAGASVGGDSPSAGRAGGYAWQLAERLYSGAQYALAFQLALAPEVGEEELAELGPEWVRPATLLALQVGWMRRWWAGARWAKRGLTGCRAKPGSREAMHGVWVWYVDPPPSASCTDHTTCTLEQARHPPPSQQHAAAVRLPSASL